MRRGLVSDSISVIPAYAGIHTYNKRMTADLALCFLRWIPAFAGMTDRDRLFKYQALRA